MFTIEKFSRNGCIHFEIVDFSNCLSTFVRLSVTISKTRTILGVKVKENFCKTSGTKPSFLQRKVDKEK